MQLVEQYREARQQLIGTGCSSSTQRINEPTRPPMVPIPVPVRGTNVNQSIIGLPVNFNRSPLNREIMRYFNEVSQQYHLNNDSRLLHSSYY